MSDKIILPKNHISLTSANMIEELLTPLKKLGVIHFTYMRNYPNLSQIYLSSNANWTEDYFNEQLYDSSQFQNDPKHYTSQYIIWPQYSHLRCYEYGREKFNSDNGMTIIKKRDEFAEFYFFSGSKENREIINTYVNHLDIFEKFILYFDDRAENILSKAMKQKLVLPSTLYASVVENTEAEFQLTPEDIDQINIDIKPKKYRVKQKGFNNIKLSSKELDCIYYMIKQRMTAKETAQVMGISHRTIESYFNNIKLKLSCDSKSDFIKFFLKENSILL